LWYLFPELNFFDIYLYIAQDIKYYMRSTIFIGIVAMMAIAVTTVSLGFGLASAQMADNATMGI
jgi:hypothetical protein